MRMDILHGRGSHTDLPRSATLALLATLPSGRPDVVAAREGLEHTAFGPTASNSSFASPVAPTILHDFDIDVDLEINFTLAGYTPTDLLLSPYVSPYLYTM